MVVVAVLSAGLAAPGSARAHFGTDGVTCAHPTLADALAALPTGGTVYVQDGVQDVTASGTSLVSVDVTLQGSDGTCSATAAGTSTLGFTGTGSILQVGASVDLVLRRIVLQGGDTPGDGGTLHLARGATLEMYDSVLEGGAAGGNGGCVSLTSGFLGLYAGSHVRHCAAGGRGGGVHADDSNVVVAADASLSSNAAAGDGGNLLIRDGTATVGGLISGGSAGGQGGGIAVRQAHGEPVVALHGTALVEHNTARDGGGISLRSDEVFLDDGLGIDAIVADAAILRANEASQDGGGIYARGTDNRIWLVGTASVVSNVAGTVGGGNGGGVSMSGGQMQLEDAVVVHGNTASEDGGGLWISGAEVSGAGLLLSGNTAGDQGGGAYVQSRASVAVDNVRTEDNGADTGAGWTVYDNARLTLDADDDLCSVVVVPGPTCSTVARNVSASGGGGILLGLGSRVDVRRTHFLRNEGSPGAALLTIVSGTHLTLRNSLVEGHLDTAISVPVGSFRLGFNTIVDNAVPLDLSGFGRLTGNVLASNTSNGWIGPAVGDCNLLQPGAVVPPGVGNVTGTPGLAAPWVPTTPSPLLVDACPFGPPTDIRGATRPASPLSPLYDRGAFEAF